MTQYENIPLMQMGGQQPQLQPPIQNVTSVKKYYMIKRGLVNYCLMGFGLLFILGILGTIGFGMSIANKDKYKEIPVAADSDWKLEKEGQDSLAKTESNQVIATARNPDTETSSLSKRDVNVKTFRITDNTTSQPIGGYWVQKNDLSQLEGGMGLFIDPVTGDESWQMLFSDVEEYSDLDDEELAKRGIQCIDIEEGDIPPSGGFTKRNGNDDSDDSDDNPPGRPGQCRHRPAIFVKRRRKCKKFVGINTRNPKCHLHVKDHICSENATFSGNVTIEGTLFVTDIQGVNITGGIVGPPGPQGPPGTPGINGTDGSDGAPGAPGINGTNGSDGAPGINGTNGSDGAPGAPGTPGIDGDDGINCWDLNQNGVCDLLTEDKNGDNLCDVKDCKGLDCWDLNGNGVCDLPIEDKNGDLVCTALDCKGEKGNTGDDGAPGLSAGELCVNITCPATVAPSCNIWICGDGSANPGQPCVITGQLSHCCSSVADCDDGIPCTIDTCENVGISFAGLGQCKHTANPVCTHDLDCAPTEVCSADGCTCIPTSDFTNFECNVDSDCPNTNDCIIGVCQTNRRCGLLSLPGCCSSNSDCIFNAPGCPSNMTGTCSSGLCQFALPDADNDNVTCLLDCDDNDSNVGKEQIFYRDNDGDGFGCPGATIIACSLPNGYVTNGNDCDDMSSLNKPGGIEVCDGRDNNCNGLIDDNTTDSGKTCFDGPGLPNTGTCMNGTSFCVNGGIQCIGQIVSQIETCNGLDDDCDGVVDNGFDLQTDPLNCNSCGNECSSKKGTPSCVNGTCQITCNLGFEDCNMINSDGCETNVNTDIVNCGACGTICSSNNAQPVCSSGTCIPVCNNGFADCDGLSVTGCEANILNSVLNCGICGRQCQTNNLTLSNLCVGGFCKPNCLPGFADCDGNSANGCESVAPCGGTLIDTLPELNDVNSGMIPQDCQVLKYNSTNQLWDSETLFLKNLGDVNNLLNPTNGEFFKYNGVEWINAPIELTLNQLIDVSVGGAVLNQFLVYNGSFWIPGDVALNFEDLLNVIGVPMTNDIPVFNGTHWVFQQNSLKNLVDTDIPVPSNNQVLTYDSSDMKWKAKNIQSTRVIHFKDNSTYQSFASAANINSLSVPKINYRQSLYRVQQFQSSCGASRQNTGFVDDSYFGTFIDCVKTDEGNTYCITGSGEILDDSFGLLYVIQIVNSKFVKKAVFSGFAYTTANDGYAYSGTITQIPNGPLLVCVPDFIENTVYIYKREFNIPLEDEIWRLIQTIKIATAVPFTTFGLVNGHVWEPISNSGFGQQSLNDVTNTNTLYSISASRDTLVIGDPLRDTDGGSGLQTQTGAVYVYGFNKTGTGLYEFEERLDFNTDKISSPLRFGNKPRCGFSVDVLKTDTTETMIIGCPYVDLSESDNDNLGTVVILDKAAGTSGNASWIDGPPVSPIFGFQYAYQETVAGGISVYNQSRYGLVVKMIEPYKAMFSAPRSENNTGRIVYIEQDNIWEDAGFAVVNRLEIPNPTNNEEETFGFSFDAQTIDGKLVTYVGAPNFGGIENGICNRTGIVYKYILDINLGTFDPNFIINSTLNNTINGINPNAIPSQGFGGFFGASVLVGNGLVSDQGYEIIVGSPGYRDILDNTGFDIGVSGALLFMKSSTTFDVITTQPNLELNSNFGSSISTTEDGNHLLIGDETFDKYVSGGGAVFYYRLNKNTGKYFYVNTYYFFQRSSKLYLDDIYYKIEGLQYPVFNMRFGASVALPPVIQNPTFNIVVGAPMDQVADGPNQDTNIAESILVSGNLTDNTDPDTPCTTNPTCTAIPSFDICNFKLGLCRRNNFRDSVTFSPLRVGSVYHFTLTTGGTFSFRNIFAQEDGNANPNRASRNQLGLEVSIFGQDIYYTAPGEDISVTNQGAAYFVVLNIPPGVLKLNSPNPTGNNNFVGFGSVLDSAILTSVNRLYNIISDKDLNTAVNGRVYQYAEIALGTELVVPGLQTNSDYGRQVAIGKDCMDPSESGVTLYVAIAAPLHTGSNSAINAGRVFIFQSSSTGSQWDYKYFIEQPTPIANRSFGTQVAIEFGILTVLNNNKEKFVYNLFPNDFLFAKQLSLTQTASGSRIGSYINLEFSFHSKTARYIGGGSFVTPSAFITPLSEARVDYYGAADETIQWCGFIETTFETNDMGCDVTRIHASAIVPFTTTILDPFLLPSETPEIKSGLFPDDEPETQLELTNKKSPRNKGMICLKEPNVKSSSQPFVSFDTEIIKGSTRVNLAISYLSKFPIWCEDSDGDGFGNATSTLESLTQPTGYIRNCDDCNDLDPQTFPGSNSETIGGPDKNCDGTILCYKDMDNDGFFGTLDIFSATPLQICEDLGQSSVVTGDCNDNNININPNITEVCNNVDDNCNGQIDENVDKNIDIVNCGSCGRECSSILLNTVVSNCTGGGCFSEQCQTNFADCLFPQQPITPSITSGPSWDARGCETDLNTVSNCGACGNNCDDLPNSLSSECLSLTCKIICESGFEDCNGNVTDGCETPINTNENCNICGNNCSEALTPPESLTILTTICVDGDIPGMFECSIDSCVSGLANCDGLFSNGCEININTDVNNCGSCGNDCNTLGYSQVATYTCSNGTCAIATCNPGFQDCNGIITDGCESPSSTDINNCGSCNNDCTALPNTNSTTCMGGSCMITSCDSGFENCDTNVNTGCEVDLNNDIDNCGTCSNECITGITTNATCSSGQCIATECSGSNIVCNNTCVDPLTDNNNCVSCGNVCTPGSCCLGTGCLKSGGVSCSISSECISGICAGTCVPPTPFLGSPCCSAGDCFPSAFPNCVSGQCSA